MDLLVILFIVLLVAWGLGVFAFHVTSGVIHVLLVVALMVLIVRLVTRRPLL